MRKALTILTLLVSLCILTQAHSAAWLSGYTTRRKLTIDHTKIDATLTDFPCLVKLTSTNFDFSKTQTNGYDIRFTSSDGTTLLKYERERHDKTNSLAEYWVKIPSVSSSAGTDFYIYFKDASIADGAASTNVWDTNYVMVQHMDDDPDTSTTQDSTSNDNDGTKTGAGQPAETDGKIGKAQDFSAGNYMVDSGDIDAIDGISRVTISVLVKPSANDDLYFISKRVGSNDDLSIRAIGTNIRGMVCNGSYSYGATADDPFSGGQWYHVVIAFDGTQSGNYSRLKIYINGSQNTSVWYSGTIPSTTSSNIGHLLYGQYSTSYFGGVGDEARICDDARTAAEIKADYNSGADTLLTYGSEEESGAPEYIPRVIFF